MMRIGNESVLLNSSPVKWTFGFSLDPVDLPRHLERSATLSPPLNSLRKNWNAMPDRSGLACSLPKANSD